MAKEKFERTKPHVNIGTMGDVDHGKTTIDSGDHYSVWQRKVFLNCVLSILSITLLKKGKRYHYQTLLT